MASSAFLAAAAVAAALAGAGQEKTLATALVRDTFSLRLQQKGP